MSCGRRQASDLGHGALVDKHPPSPLDEAVSERTQARYIEQALYLLWKQRVKVAINYRFGIPGGGPVPDRALLHGREREARLPGLPIPVRYRAALA